MNCDLNCIGLAVHKRCRQLGSGRSQNSLKFADGRMDTSKKNADMEQLGVKKSQKKGRRLLWMVPSHVSIKRHIIKIAYHI